MPKLSFQSTVKVKNKIFGVLNGGEYEKKMIIMVNLKLLEVYEREIILKFLMRLTKNCDL